MIRDLDLDPNSTFPVFRQPSAGCWGRTKDENERVEGDEDVSSETEERSQAL